MTGIREPISPALASDLVLWIASDEQPRLSDAMNAESLFGYVDHGIVLGFLEKTNPVSLTCEDKQATFEEDAPLRIAGLFSAAIQLSYWTGTVIGGHVQIGLLAEPFSCRQRGEKVGPAIVPDGVFGPAGDQLAVANQADRTVAAQSEILTLFEFFSLRVPADR